MSALAKAHPWLQALVPYEPGKPIEDVARELDLEPESIIKLASNENPLGPSPKALEAMEQHAAAMHIYPDGGSWKLRERLAAKHGLAPDNIALGNGSNELIELLGHALSGPGKRTVAGEHAFVVYRLMTELFGGQFHSVTDQQFEHDLDAMAQACQHPEVTQVFLANPNNPTGTSVSQRELDRFVDAVPENVLIILDEAYHEVSSQPLNALKYLHEGRKNIVITRTFSKILGLAGLRIGYALADKEVIGVFGRTRQPFNVNAMAQAAALAALDDREHIDNTRALTHAGLEFYYQELGQLGLRYLPSEANFVMTEVGDANAVFQHMLAQGVIIRSLAAYQLPRWVRITVGKEQENIRCIAALKQALAQTGVERP